MHERAERAVLSRTQAFSDTTANWFGKRRNVFLFFLILSFVLRVATFGHPNMDSDEAFYFLVGQEMHKGSVPYVDIWDRKPIGLFILYYIFTIFSDSVLSYQIAAWLAVAATAFFIYLLASRWSGVQGGVLAGSVYVFVLPLFLGFGGQAPVIYNAFIAWAVLLVLTALPAMRRGEVPWHVYAAVTLCGLAITIKQTTLFESGYLGLTIAYVLWRSPAPRPVVIRTVLLCAVIGIAPTLAATTWYWLNGYWHEYWHAMVQSNLSKKQPTGVTVAARLINTYFRLWPLIVTTILGFVLPWAREKWLEDKEFVVGWLVAAIIGYVAVPNFYPHYVLPLFVPMCVISALFFARRDVGMIAFMVVAGLSLHWHDAFAFRYTRMAQFSVYSLANSIKDHDGGRGLLVYDGPVLLYSLSGNAPLSPLALPLHLNYDVEADVSHLRTTDEVARILARKPGAVAMAVLPRNNPRNTETFRMVLDYVLHNCRLVDTQMSSEQFRTDLIAVYGDCNAVHPPLQRSSAPPAQ